jgi:hypothetical protein
MIRTLPIFVILIFAVLTASVASAWQEAVFRAGCCCADAAYLLSGARSGTLVWRWAILPFGLITLWGLLQCSLGSTVWPQATWHETLLWTAYLALFFASTQTPGLRRNLRFFAWAGGILALYAIVRYAAWPAAGDRMAATFLNQNHYAAWIELLFPIALFRLFRDKTKSLYALCALLMVLSVALAGSRAGILLIIAETVYVVLRLSSRSLLVAGGALLIVAMSAGLMWNRFALLASDEPYESRNATARASVRMIQARPMLGYGLGTWPNVYPAFAERDTGFRLIHADNDWLEWTAEGGLPFVAMLLAIAAVALVAAYREPWSVGCVAVMLHSLVEFPLHKQAVWAWLVTVLAAAQFRSALRKHSS